MPRFPQFSSTVAEIKGSIFSALAHRLTTHQGEVYPLHIGDTWMEPAAGCRMEDLTVDDHPGMHRYCSPQGLPELLDAIGGRLSQRTGIPSERKGLLVTAGATGALGAVAGAILEPGDEVLILAPHWPLIAGIVRSFHGTPIAVPLIGNADSPETAVEAARSYVTDRTVALYLSSPNNPTGTVLPSSWIGALVEWCRQRNLWILADEVYEDYVYTGLHTYARSLAPERTFSVHSFSKAFGMAGNRCGYVAGPTVAVGHLRKVSIHTFYSTPTAAQLAAIRVLDGRGDSWIAGAKQKYMDAGNAAADRLGVPQPQGSQFLFLDVAERLDDRGLIGFLEDCVDRGLFLAPGPSFGPYPTHVRICFTSAPPPVVGRGIEVMAEILGR
jgi:aspartate/methionine/tyrosine aminotransferase